MLRDDLALLKMAWLNHAISRYDTLNEVARDAARVLPLLQQEFTAEIDRTTTTGAIDKSVMEGEAARRAASDKHFGMTASEAGAAEAAAREAGSSVPTFRFLEDDFDRPLAGATSPASLSQFPPCVESWPAPSRAVSEKNSREALEDESSNERSPRCLDPDRTKR